MREIDCESVVRIGGTSKFFTVAYSRKLVSRTHTLASHKLVAPQAIIQ